METKINFLVPFKRRMLALSVITALFIALSTPLTYSFMAWQEIKVEALDHSDEIAARLTEHVRKNPRLWQFNVQKFLQVLDEAQINDINTINIYNDKRDLVYQEVFYQQPFFEIAGVSSIKYNNQIYGYIEVKHQSHKKISEALGLLLLFSIIGCVTGYVLYKYPTRVVEKSEQEVDQSLERLKALSYLDPLTELPNRRYFQNLMQKLFIKAAHQEKKVALMFLDLDEFKYINDSYGHNVGDSLLKAVAQRLVKCIRKGDFVARMGGDEFTVILSDIKSEEEVIFVANRIISEMEAPFKIELLEVLISTSIGISVFPDNGTSVELLVQSADKAMFQAKEAGKSKYIFFKA